MSDEERKIIEDGANALSRMIECWVDDREPTDEDGKAAAAALFSLNRLLED